MGGGGSDNLEEELELAALPSRVEGTSGARAGKHLPGAPQLDRRRPKVFIMGSSRPSPPLLFCFFGSDSSLASLLDLAVERRRLLHSDTPTPAQLS